MSWECRVPVSRVFELRCRVMDYFGVGALGRVRDVVRVLRSEGVGSVLVVTDEKVYRVTGVWDVLRPALEEAGLEYAVFEGVIPNPTTECVDRARDLGLEVGAGAVIAVGGGSHIDTAKGAAILMEYADRSAEELYELKFTPERAKPVVAINTTHGTGSEVDRFAVASIVEKGFKPAIAYDIIYPRFSIDDPAVTRTLPPGQTRYTAIDALNHVTEAATTRSTNPYSIALGVEAARLIFKYLPAALEDPGDLRARYYLLYASAIAGISFDIALLHLTHALEHPLSALKPDLPHGLGLAMLLPSVVKAVYPAKPEVLAELYRPIAPELKGLPGEAAAAAVRVEEWLFSVGVRQKLQDVGFGEDDIGRLVELALTTPSLDLLLRESPIGYDREVLERIYRESLAPLSRV